MFDRAHWERVGGAICPTDGTPLIEYHLDLLRFISHEFVEATQDWSLPHQPEALNEAYWAHQTARCASEYAASCSKARAHLEAHRAQHGSGNFVNIPWQERRREIFAYEWNRCLDQLADEWSARTLWHSTKWGSTAQRERLHELARALRTDFGLAGVDIQIHQPLTDVIRSLEGLRGELERLAVHLGVRPRDLGRGTLQVHLTGEAESNRMGAMATARDETIAQGHGRLFYTVYSNERDRHDGLVLAHEWAHLWDAMLAHQGIDAPQALLTILEEPWRHNAEAARARTALAERWNAFTAGEGPYGLSNVWVLLFQNSFAGGEWETPLRTALEPLRSQFSDAAFQQWHLQGADGVARARNWIDRTHEAVQQVLVRHSWTANVNGDQALAKLHRLHQDMHRTVASIANGVPHPRAAIELMGSWLDRAFHKSGRAYWGAPEELWARALEHVVHALDQRTGHDTERSRQRMTHPAYFSGLGLEARMMPWLMGQSPSWGVVFPGIAGWVADAMGHEVGPEGAEPPRRRRARTP